MFATATTHKHPVMSVFEGLKAFRTSMAFRGGRAHATNRQGEADLERMSLRTLDDLGLLPADGCMTDWGLLESAARLRSGWS